MVTSLPKLYIPGPVAVSAGTFKAMSQPLMPHRSQEFQALYASTQPTLQALAGTKRPFYLVTAPSSALMESVPRQLGTGRVLCCTSGAFSERWADIARSCGREVDVLALPWGEVITPELLKRALRQRHYDLVTLVHVETSTSVLNPLAQLAQVVREESSALLAVDSVSSFSALPLFMDEWGVDVILAGAQKAVALPPGLSLLCVSERALQKAAQSTQAGYFLNYLEWEKNASQQMTVATPSIPHIYGLAYNLGQMEKEGLSERFLRHSLLQQKVQHWAESEGIALMAPEGFRAPTVTCFQTPKDWDLALCLSLWREKQGVLLDGGYGLWKGKTFRLAHMGNESLAEMDKTLESLVSVLG